MDRVASRGPLPRTPGALKGGHFRNCQHFCLNWRGDLFKFSEKNLTVPKKTERGDPLGFSNMHSDAKQLKGGPFGENFFPEKSLAVPKKIERGDPLVSPGMVCYAEKQEKPFWFSSLGQMEQRIFFPERQSTSINCQEKATLLEVGFIKVGQLNVSARRKSRNNRKNRHRGAIKKRKLLPSNYLSLLICTFNLLSLARYCFQSNYPGYFGARYSKNSEKSSKTKTISALRKFQVMDSINLC